MRRPDLALPLLLMALVACSDGGPGGSAADAGVNGPAATAADAGMDVASSPAPGGGQPDADAPAQGDTYQLLGIKDPELGIVASVMKIPRGWRAKQAFQRQWNGANPVIQVYVVFRSPDAKQQIEYLPGSQYVYSDGPGPGNLRMQKQAMGIDPRMAENELPPMPALSYLRNYLLPMMAQQGVTLRDMGNERETAPHPEASPGSDKPHMASSASVDGILPNGNRARVEVRIGRNEMRNNQDVYYSWWATPSITQTGDGDLDATYAHTETAQASVVYNPAWLGKNRELVAAGNRATSDAIRSQHAASMENIAQWGRINRANAAASSARLKSDAATTAALRDQNAAAYDARMARNDRNNELFADVVINGEAKYANPTTGERIKIDSSYDHTYTDNNGYYYQSNTPLESDDVNWQEMQKVPFDDY